MAKRPTATERTQAYVDGVSSGSLPAPVFVKRSVEKWKVAAEKWDCDYDKFNRAVRMIEVMPCPEGAIKKFSLWGWQCFVLSWLFLFYTDGKDESDGKPRKAIKELFLTVPRKAGKSSLLAASALANLAEPCGDVNAPLIFCFGVTDKTAKITLDKARSIVKSDAANWKERKGGKFIKAFGMSETQEKIYCGKTRGEIRPLTSMARNLEGYTAEIIIADEISRLKTTQELDILRAGFAAAYSPQFIMTSTPSDLRYSAYDIELERAMRWLGMQTDGADREEGSDDDPNYAAIVYAATESDDPGDEKVWATTQPSYEHLGMHDYYRRQWRKAQTDQRAFYTFKTWNLCIPEKIAGDWISIDDWLATNDPPHLPARETGWWSFVGIDLSDVKDMTAICILQVHPEANEQRVWFECHYPRGSLPTSLTNDNSKEIHVENDAYLWAKEGWLEVHEGKVIDHQLIAKRLMEINKNLNPLVITSDQYSALEEVKRFCSPETKAKVRIYGKSMVRHTVPLATLSTWVFSNTISIQKHPIAERHLRNSNYIQGRYGGSILQKPTATSTSKIDCMDAFMCAIGAWVNSQDDKLLGSEDAPHPTDSKALDFGFKVLGV